MHSTNKIQIIMNTFSIHSIIPQKNCLLNISNFHLPDIRLYIPFITIKFTITANKYHETVSLQFSWWNKRLVQHFCFFVPHMYCTLNIWQIS